jgi:hypothetical protein
LIDQNMAPRSVADYQGKVALLFFGYTHWWSEAEVDDRNPRTRLRRIRGFGGLAHRSTAGRGGGYWN